MQWICMYREINIFLAIPNLQNKFSVLPTQEDTLVQDVCSTGNHANDYKKDHIQCIWTVEDWWIHDWSSHLLWLIFAVIHKT